MYSTALPFLVITVGFERPLILTKSVVSKVSKAKSSEALQPLIAEGVADVAPALLTDCAFEVTALGLASISGIEGAMGDFCLVAAYIIFFDCAFMFTYFVSILTLKLEVCPFV